MKKIIFICDYFLNTDGVGGAELTTDAIMRFGANRGFDIGAVHCNKVSIKAIEEVKDDYHFIICNFIQLQDDIKLYMVKNCSYSIVEYDYKICKYRSFELHEMSEGAPCDCETTAYGKLNSVFYGYAEKIWFMSEKQKRMIMDKVSVLKEEKCEVLNSVFSAGDLRFIFSIKDNEKNNKYLILDSDSPVKPSKLSVDYAEANNLEYELVTNMPYHELLIKMSMSKGLIFMPVASDTCPRLVMEAKMLGGDVILNEHVQHKDEPWFKTQDSCFEHLDNRSDAFWSHYE
tara:strand:+ start:925 stop:1785 length:861 start_codon:yes stop_codon:yes gene_type:complete